MDLMLTDERALLRDTTRRYLENESPVGALRALEGVEPGYDLRWWQRGAELGWASMLISEERGGGSVSGEGLVDLALIAQEMGRVAAPGLLLPVNVTAAVLERSGAGDQLELLPGIVAGRVVVAWAPYSAGLGWAGERTLEVTTARGGGYRLSGTTGLVEAGAVADFLLVAARPDGALTHLLVPAATPGVRVETPPGLDLGRRFASVSFADVVLPGSAVVGQSGAGPGDWAYAGRVAAVLQVAESAGAMARVLDMTLEFMRTRISFGRPLSSYQALKHRVADMKMWLEVSLALAAAAARAVQHESPDAGTLASAAKSYVGEKSTDLIQDCVQIHGGMGVTWEHDLHLYLRRATVNRFTYGTPEDHREHLASLAAS